MRTALAFKKYILLIITLVIVIGGSYFDICETYDLFNNMECNLSEYTCDSGAPLQNVIKIKGTASFIAAVAEIKDAGMVREIIKRLENSSNNKTIIVLILIFFICISLGSFVANVYPSLFPWTEIITSRRSVISYIHLQDGEK